MDVFVNIAGLRQWGVAECSRRYFMRQWMCVCEVAYVNMCKDVVFRVGQNNKQIP